MSLTCRVQYLNDIDPFSYTTNFPDPARPPLHTFNVDLPLINQLAAVHRLLKSPHRVSSDTVYVCSGAAILRMLVVVARLRKEGLILDIDSI